MSFFEMIHGRDRWTPVVYEPEEVKEPEGIPERFLIGLDLGQAKDWTAIAVVQELSPPKEQKQYNLLHLERPQLGTPYPAIVAGVKELVNRVMVIRAGKCELIVDATGVGAPVVDMLKQANLGCPVTAAIITGGDQVHREGGKVRVPKRDLVGAAQVLLQSGRLKAPADLPLARTLIEELLSLKVRINAQTAHDSYDTWRSGVHDDLVLAVALACWWAETHRPMRVLAIKW